MTTAAKVRASYLPQAGDIIWLELSPVAGHEQAGRRPCLVLSDYDFNALSGRAVICPITSRSRNGVFEVRLSGTATSGVVLTDHIRTVDLAARFCQKIEVAPSELLLHCRQLTGSLIGLGEK
jgi:mRNA interferase MazF